MKTGFKKIQSLKNPVIGEALNIKNKRHKYRHDAFIIEGPHLVENALSKGIALKRVFVAESYMTKADAGRLISRLKKTDAGLYIVDERIISRVSDTKTPQGILAIASYKPVGLNELGFKGAPLLVVSDGIQEPGNLGALIRTSDAFGADALIMLPGTCDAFSPKTLRATAGSIFNIPIVYAERNALVDYLKANGIGIFAASPHAGKSISDVDFRPPLAIVFGNEAKGVSKIIKEASDVEFEIPIQGGAESLNVASAAAICLYEAMRQRRL